MSSMPHGVIEEVVDFVFESVLEVLFCVRCKIDTSGMSRHISTVVVGEDVDKLIAVAIITEFNAVVPAVREKHLET